MELGNSSRLRRRASSRLLDPIEQESTAPDMPRRYPAMY